MNFAMQQADPRMQEVMKYIQQFGGDERSAFYALAKQKGADPDMVLNQARQMMTSMQKR